MRFFLCCCLLGLFLATGTCLECESCFGLGESCNGIKKRCAEGEDTCFISQTQLIQFPAIVKVTMRGCGQTSECNTGMHELELGNNMRVRMDRVCCTGDKCETISGPALPPPDAQANGLQCPGCFGIFSKHCYPRPVSCTGANTHCIEFTGHVAQSIWDSEDLVLRGCASHTTFSNLNSILNAFGGVKVDVSVNKCTTTASV